MEEIIVYKNQELRDILESKGLNDQTIQVLDVKLYFKKWCSYEDGVIYTGLEYKGYRYELEGILEEKWSDTQLFVNYEDYKPFKTLDEFFEKIKDYEIHVLEHHLSYEYIGEPDTWNFRKINWLDDVPKNIREEFHERYIATDEYDSLYDTSNIRYDGVGGNFYQKSNNIEAIVLNIKSKSEDFRIKWLNKFQGFPHLDLVN